MDEGLAREIEGLKECYGGVSVAAGSPGQTLIRVAEARLPKGCAPVSTPVLLIVQAGQRPQLHVKGGIRLPHGAVPRNYNASQVAGEEWWVFSYSFPWVENENTLSQFVGASLQRFGKNE